MDKKRIVLFSIVTLFASYAFSQQHYDYQQINNNKKADADALIFQDNVNSFVINDKIPIGYINLTNVFNMVSYNPIEGTRFRVSAETNTSFSKRLAISGMVAYGTKDNKIKYSAGVGYNFARKAKGLYSFPCSTLSLIYSNNTYMPSYPNYDVAFFSLGDWDRFYFASKQEANFSFLQEFPSTFAFRPFATYQKINDFWLYDNETKYELISKPIKNYSFGTELSFSPYRKEKFAFNILNSRFYSFYNKVSLTYSYNIIDNEEYKNEEYQKIELDAAYRLMFKPMCFDSKVTVGKIFGNTSSYLYFTPNYRTSTVSNNFGFNLYGYSSNRYEYYIQTFNQLNLGGVLLDNISFFKSFRPNEFINLKCLFTKYDPYYEVGAGIDHIFGCLGFEVMRRISNSNPYDMPLWGFKVRLTIG